MVLKQPPRAPMTRTCRVGVGRSSR